MKDHPIGECADPDCLHDDEIRELTAKTELRVSVDSDGRTVLTCLSCGEMRQVRDTHYQSLNSVGTSFGLPYHFTVGLAIDDMFRDHQHNLVPVTDGAERR